MNLAVNIVDTNFSGREIKKFTLRLVSESMTVEELISRRVRADVEKFMNFMKGMRVVYSGFSCSPPRRVQSSFTTHKSADSLPHFFSLALPDNDLRGAGRSTAGFPVVLPGVQWRP
ncbi:MAG: hypothetical protein GY859_34215 [Desulfobacterales bacterium]|nr:hypothetical protein [Desulfobacterales bacterium]